MADYQIRQTGAEFQALLDSIYGLGLRLGGVLTPGATIATPLVDTFWFAPAGTYTYGESQTYTVSTGYLGIIQYMTGTAAWSTQQVLIGTDAAALAACQAAVAELSENLQDVEDNIQDGVNIVTDETTNLPYTLNPGFIGGNGTITTAPASSPYRYTNPIAVQAGQVIDTIFSGNYTMGLAAYTAEDTNNAVVGKSIICRNVITEASYVVPDGISYIRVCFKNDISTSNFYIKLHITLNLLDKIENVESEFDGIDANIHNIEYAPTLYDFGVLNYGYIGSNGVITTGGAASPYRYTNLIPVQAGQQVDTAVSGNNIMGIAAYSSTDTTHAIVSKSYIVPNIVINKTYIVPEGVAYLRICFNRTTLDEPYVKIHNLLLTKEQAYNNAKDIDGIVKNSLLTYDALERYDGQAYYNGALSTVSSANCKKFDVSTLEYLYVRAHWFSQSAGYYMITFTDENNNVIEQKYPNNAELRTWLRYEKISIPDGAVYMYLNSRYTEGNAYTEFSSSAIEKKIASATLSREISILFIGNSLTQDAVSYVPLLLKELAPDLKFKFYIYYNGGYTLAQQLAQMNNSQNCEIFSICENSISWTNQNNSVKMSSVLSNYTFDVVCLQEYFNYQESANVNAFNSIIEYIENNYGHPFKCITFFHQPKRDNAAVIYERTKAGNALLLKETIAEDMIASGMAIYRAMSTSLDELGDQGHLSPDGTHSQEGLPCMMQAYVTAMWILKQVGITMSVNNASAIVDNSNYSSINVPGPNLGSGVVIGTTEQVRLSQKVAIKAYKEGIALLNANLTENI